MSETDQPNLKVIAAAAIGALGGLFLASYLCKAKHDDSPLSKHVAALSKLIEQIEHINNDMEAEGLKKRLESLITTIEKSYGKPEE